MPVLDAEELAELRADVREAMLETEPDLCDIARGETEERNPDAPDQFTTAPNVVEASVPCRYRVANSSDRFLAGKPADMNFYTVIVPAGIDVKENDNLKILAKGDDDEILLRVDTVSRQSNALKWKLICGDA